MPGWLALLLLALLPGSAETASKAQSVAVSTCDQSTVEVWGPDYAAQAKRFLVRLQRIVKRDDKRQLSLIVQFPVQIIDGNKRTALATPGEMIRRYPSIMQPVLKKAILVQSPECLFANGQGVMIGTGQIWFQRQSGGQMKIITFNLSAFERGQ